MNGEKTERMTPTDAAQKPTIAVGSPPPGPVSPEQPATWKFRSDQSADGQPGGFAPTPPNLGSVRWTASQFVAHQKNAQWYVGLGLAAILVAALVFLITKDKITAIVIVVAALFFGVMAGRKPRVLEYEISSNGITIGRQFFTYGVFKSFALVEEGAVSGAVFMPLKRFMPGVTIYFSHDDEEKIVALLSTFLPMHQAKKGALDNFLEHIRF